MNKFTGKMHKEIKEERFTVVVFENGRRIMTMGNLHLLGAMEAQVSYQAINRTILMVNDFHLKDRAFDKMCISRDIHNFKDLFDLKSKALKGGN
jgi:hypothetical protein